MYKRQEFGTTMIYITHDQEEAFALSDRIMIMDNAKLVQIDTPEQIIESPAEMCIRDRGVGSAALGAVNIGVPFITFVVAIAAMFPYGGTTVAGIRMGRGDEAGANRAFMTAFSLTLFISLILMLVGMVFSRQIVDISGARELSAEMREMSEEYLFYYSAFSVPMLLSTCLSVFVRNDGSPTLSFVGMCVGAVANLSLIHI